MMWLMMLIAWLPYLLFGGALVFLGFRAVRALERRGEGSAELVALRDRVHALEDTVTTQGEELRRLEEGHEFTQRLLMERSADGGAATKGLSTG